MTRWSCWTPWSVGRVPALSQPSVPPPFRLRAYKSYNWLVPPPRLSPPCDRALYSDGQLPPCRHPRAAAPGLVRQQVALRGGKGGRGGGIKHVATFPSKPRVHHPALSPHMLTPMPTHVHTCTATSDSRQVASRVRTTFHSAGPNARIVHRVTATALRTWEGETGGREGGRNGRGEGGEGGRRRAVCD